MLQPPLLVFTLFHGKYFLQVSVNLFLESRKKSITNINKHYTIKSYKNFQKRSKKVENKVMLIQISLLFFVSLHVKAVSQKLF